MLQEKNVRLILDPVPKQSIPEVTKVLCSLITTSIKKGDCYYARKCVAFYCVNWTYQIQGIDLDQSYSSVAHDDSFRITISIASIHRLTDNILDVINAFQNKNVPIHERVYVITPPNYLHWF